MSTNEGRVSDASKSGFSGVIIAALAAVVLWGASSVATKFAIAAMPALAVAVLRTALAGIVVLPFALLMHVPLPPTLEQRSGVSLIAFAGFIAFPVLFSLGMTLTSAIHGVMILAVLPIATGAIALAWDRHRPSIGWWLGCIIALAGEVVLSLGRSDLKSADGNLAGDLLVLLSVMFGALGNVMGARLQQKGFPAMATTVWSSVLATVGLCPFLPWVTSRIAWHLVTPSAWAGVAYLAFAVTILGYGLWYWALGRGGIARIGLTQFLQPVSGVLLAWVLLGERLTASMLLATVLILLGVGIAGPATAMVKAKHQQSTAAI